MFLFLFFKIFLQDLPAQRHSTGDARQLSSSSALGRSYTSAAKQYDHFRNYDKISQLSGGLMTEENLVDANSEKELVGFSF
jgi:hypothetical protein